MTLEERLLDTLHDVEDADRFQEVLNGQVIAPGDVQPWASDSSVSFTGGFSRNLWTILPTDPADINGHLIGNGKTKLTDGQDYVYPSSSQCMSCHTAVAGTVLGLETR